MSTVYWLTGLSGAGKTTIGRELYNQLKIKNSSVILLDGDELREVFGGVFGYSEDERRKCAMCYSRLCKLLSEQGITVVCCTISMFDSVRQWNRNNITKYKEIYVKASNETLLSRNQKELYSGIHQGLNSNVMGMDIQIEEPKSPDVIIENNGQLSTIDCVKIILENV